MLESGDICLQTGKDPSLETYVFKQEKMLESGDICLQTGKDPSVWRHMSSNRKRS